MPSLAPKQCTYPGCSVRVQSGRCAEHRAQAQRQHEQYRLSAQQRGYDKRWHKASKAHLAENPLCAECLRHGRYVPAACTDHVVPHKGDPVLFWDPNNWQSLCLACNSAKAAREEGGFGNPERGRGSVDFCDIAQETPRAPKRKPPQNR